jgi:hypothetical protein
MIDGAEFERCFAEWVRQLAGLTSKVIAIDHSFVFTITNSLLISL